MVGEIFNWGENFNQVPLNTVGIQTRITVGNYRVPFNIKATRWLGTYLDSRLSFSEHAKISARRARTAEGRLRSIVTRHGVPPLSARHLQEAIVGSTMMYGAEVTWRGQVGMSSAFQKGINRMTRATLGVLPSTPVAFLQAEGGSIPAVARLQGRQEAFAIRLAAREEPADGLLRAGTGLGKRLRDMTKQGTEQIRASRGMVFPGVIEVPAICHNDEDRRTTSKDAEEEARTMNGNVNTVWTDGSRLEDGRVGAGVAWYEDDRKDSGRRLVVARRDFRTGGKRREGQGGYLGKRRSMIEHQGGWRSDGFSLGGGYEAYDGELAALVYGLVVLHGRGQSGTDYTIFTDSTAAMTRLKGDAHGPGQEMAIRAIEIAERITRGGNTITFKWTPAHAGVEGNERADMAAKSAATLPPLRGTRDRYSLAYLKRGTTEGIMKSWIADTETRMTNGGRDRGAFRKPEKGARPRIRGPLRKVGKGVASRFFQLLSGHAMIAPFLKDRLGWTDSDSCWWCNGGRQSRDHLFKECTTWKKEIAELWKEVEGYQAKEGRARERNVTTTRTRAHSRVERGLDFMSGRLGRGPATPR